MGVDVMVTVGGGTEISIDYHIRKSERLSDR